MQRRGCTESGDEGSSAGSEKQAVTAAEPGDPAVKSNQKTKATRAAVSPVEAPAAGDRTAVAVHSADAPKD